MKRVLLVVVMCLIWTVAAWAQCQPDHYPAGHYKDGEVLVRFAPLAERGTAMRDLHAKEIARIWIGDHYVEHWNVGSGGTEKAVEVLKHNPNVVYAEPNYAAAYLMRDPHVVTNDPLLPKYQWQWRSPTTVCGPDSLSNVTSCSTCPQPADADIDAEHAWDITMGSPSIVVGDQEGEPDYSHPDIQAMRYVNAGENCGSIDPTIVCAQRTNGIDDDVNGKVDDVYGWDFFRNLPASTPGAKLSVDSHATRVWGMIGGGNNGIGGTGIAPGVRVMPILTGGDVSSFAMTYAYAASRGVKAINMSFGSLTYSQTFHDAICGSPILFVASVGNSAANNDDPTRTQYPAGYDCANLITVAASTCVNTMASFSNWGTTTPESASSVDLFAPGANIYSDAGPLAPGPCLPAGRVATGCAITCNGCAIGAPACLPDDNPNPSSPGPICDLLIETAGTSFSAPTVVGVAALIYTLKRAWTAIQVKSTILNNVDLYAAFNNKCVTGGKVNAYKAVLAAQQSGGGGGPGCPPACQEGPH